ncbi:MAG: hypothetical protein GY754_30845 [bacterium]|nr:hypothetical protein [bacterium]
MLYNKKESNNKWKNEQIDYFKRYLATFDSSSREYKLIKQGLDELEQSL